MRIKTWLICIILSLFLGCSESGESLPVRQSITDELDILKYEKKVYQNYRIREWNSVLFQLDNISLTSVSAGPIELADLVDHDLEFIFYYSTNCCMTCVDDYLNILNNLFSNESRESISIISNYRNLRELKSKLYDMDLDLEAYNYQEIFDIPLNENSDHDSPLMFLIDKDLTVHLPRVGVTPDSISNPYFDRVKELLINSHPRK